MRKVKEYKVHTTLDTYIYVFWAFNSQTPSHISLQSNGMQGICGVDNLQISICKLQKMS